MIKSYRVTAAIDRGSPEMKADVDDTVYDCILPDYGCAIDDTRMLGQVHVSVTRDPAGGYPFLPSRDLRWSH